MLSTGTLTTTDPFRAFPGRTLRTLRTQPQHQRLALAHRSSAEPGNPRPSHNGYFCRTGDSTEVGATYFCPLRQACVPAAEWDWEGPEHRPCALWTGTAWEYNSKRTPTTNSWAAPPVTLKAQPSEAAVGSPPTAAHVESRIVGLARLRSLTAKATATLTRLRDRA